jgi:predicted kinase
MLCLERTTLALPLSAISELASQPGESSLHPLDPAAIIAIVATLLFFGLAVASVVARVARRTKGGIAVPCECRTTTVELTWDELAERLSAPPGSKRLVVLVAIQGSGKSLLASKLAAKGFEWLSIDQIVAKDPRLAYAPFQRAQKYYQQFTAALLRGANVVDDNLNIVREEQDESIKIGRRAGYTDIVLVHFDFPIEKCIAHNRLRPEAGVTEAMIRESWEELKAAGAPDQRGVRLIRLTPGPADGVLVAQDKNCNCTAG